MSAATQTAALPEMIDALMAPDASSGAQLAAAERLFAFCANHTGNLSDQDLHLPSGKALSPAGAARCITDFRRTICFLRGVRAAVETALLRRPQRPVHVVYAGCGPVATLALALLRCRPADVALTLIDAHAETLESAQQFLQMAGAGLLLRQAHCADAATIQLNGDARANVLIAEVMQRALAREPQLAVTANLMAQAEKDAILVPRRITVDAVLVDVAAEQLSDRPRRHVPLGRLIDVSAESVGSLSQQLAEGALPAIRLHVPQDAPMGLELSLRTEIEVAPGIVLGAYDSGITYPHYLFELGRIPPGAIVACQYLLGADPGFRCRLE